VNISFGSAEADFGRSVGRDDKTVYALRGVVHHELLTLDYRARAVVVRSTRVRAVAAAL
jgi:predicted RNA-binding protein YlqC (UPF0109 family)